MFVQWGQYEANAPLDHGFIGPPADEVVTLRKALIAGSSRDPPPSVVSGDGFALRVESLESTMKVTTYTAKHIVLWRMLQKIPAFNMVEEYNRLHEYGALDQTAFIAEGELPVETDSDYERVFAYIKFLGTTRRVTHPMTLVRAAHGNVITQQTYEGTMYLLRQLERGLFTARGDLDGTQFDGFDRLIRDNVPATHIIDKRGAPLTEDNLVDGTLTTSNPPSYGISTDLFANPMVITDLSKAFFPKARYDLMQKPDGTVGLNVTGFNSPTGAVRFNQDVFIDDGGQVPAAAVGDLSRIPATPAIAVAPAAGALASAPLWLAGSGAHSAGGAYIWSVVACNRYGQSAALRVPAAGTFTPTATASVTFSVIPVGPIIPTYYKVYRTVRGGTNGTQRLILRVPNAAGAAAQVITDLNARLPGCTSAYLFQLDPENMAFAQLAPMSRISLATVDPTIRWMQVIYGAPKLYAPRHHLIYDNVGRATGSVGAV